MASQEKPEKIISKKNISSSDNQKRKITSFFSRECNICHANHGNNGHWCRSCSGGNLIYGKYGGHSYQWVIRHDLTYSKNLMFDNTEECFSKFRDCLLYTSPSPRD